MAPLPPVPEQQADALLGGTGARRSGPRRRVLMYLLEQGRGAELLVNGTCACRRSKARA